MPLISYASINTSVPRPQTLTHRSNVTSSGASSRKASGADVRECLSVMATRMNAKPTKSCRKRAGGRCTELNASRRLQETSHILQILGMRAYDLPTLMKLLEVPLWCSPPPSAWNLKTCTVTQKTRLSQNESLLGSEKPERWSDGSPAWLEVCTLRLLSIQRCQNRDRAPCSGGWGRHDHPDADIAKIEQVRSSFHKALYVVECDLHHFFARPKGSKHDDRNAL